MGFTVEDFEDFYRLLGEHPEWRERLRPLLLGVEVPERLSRIEVILETLSERQAATETTVRDLAERMERVEEQIARLATAVETLSARLDRADGRASNIEGLLLEQRYERHLGQWLADELWPIARVLPDELDGVRSALDRGTIAEAELRMLRNADLLVRGTRRDDPGAERIYVFEVSYTINPDDVERANTRAGVLRKAGYDALGFAGGYRITEDAQELADALSVKVDLRRPAAA